MGQYRCGGDNFLFKEIRLQTASTKCPIEIGSFESTILITSESALEKERKAAYREIRKLGERLQGIEDAISSFRELG